MIISFFLLACGIGIGFWIIHQRMRQKNKWLRRNQRQLQILSQLGRRLIRFTEDKEVRSTLQEISKLIQSAMGCPSCTAKIWYFAHKEVVVADVGDDSDSWREPVHWQWDEPVDAETNLQGTPLASQARQFLCLPIREENQSYGVLQVGCAGSCVLGDDDFRFHALVAQELLVAFRQIRLVDDLKDNMEDLQMTMKVGLFGLTTFTGSIRGMEETVSAVLKQVVHLLNVDRATLLLWDEKQQLLWPRTATGMRHRPPTLFLQLGEGIAGWALKTGKPYVAQNAQRDVHFIPAREPIRSIVCMPMVTKDGAKLGVLCASTIETEKQFNDRDLAYLSLFAAHVALAVENAQLHQRERDQTKELDMLNQLKNDMLSIVSHDLQVPLTGILGYSRMILDGSHPIPEEVHQFVQNILWSAEEENRIIQNLLDMTRLSRSQIVLERTPCDLKIMVLEQVDKFRMICSHRPLNIDFQPTAEDLVLDLDQTRIHQVINNLLANAAKFSSDGGTITIGVSGDSKHVHVSVQDDGIGIPPEEMGKVFMKYYQIYNTKGETNAQGGLGLGLAICKLFVEAHGGSIWAESPGLGKGSTFHFTIPKSIVPSSLADIRKAA